MDNSCCYSLTLNQVTCQNGISMTPNSTHTNLTSGTDIELYFGYILRFVTGNQTYATISIRNEIFLPETTFNIPEGSYRVFDLPCECGTYRLAIRANLVPCACTTICCDNLI